MDLKQFDNKCVRITDIFGEAYEGIVSYDSEEYAFHEYGRNQEALHMTPMVFYRDDIASVTSLEDVNGPFGHYSEKYGLLEKKCLEWGTDMIEEVLDSEDDTGVSRMLDCMTDNFTLLTENAVPGLAPWRTGGMAEDAESGQGPVYLEELRNMLGSLVKYNDNKENVKKAEDLLERLKESFEDETDRQ